MTGLGLCGKMSGRNFAEVRNGNIRRRAMNRICKKEVLINDGKQRRNRDFWCLSAKQ
ncbi:hypothetical protein SAMN02745136_02291 [Anaerocolumna jejuensis DSM 15929]|uniref:Uncharacterized protein n=1 Tax=Anaerocolumna jejuensis DSM 15929 TaxID=1121322 RepID=A0A1M6RUC3_9FIRM|nr:hypothetical protein SAMN02745136_02291 [Anaerocolumna jejuensis DSM 15929]